MAKTIMFRQDNQVFSGNFSSAIRKEDLYGKQSREYVFGEQVLVKKYLTDDGQLLAKDQMISVSYDNEGSAYDKSKYTRDGEDVAEVESSFKDPRKIVPMEATEMSRFVESGTYPIDFTEMRPVPGFYSTEFIYHGGANVQEAVLDVRESGASFLRIGKKVTVNPVGMTVQASIFDTEEDTEEDSEGISFGF